ncbi:hypothetical protein QZH41_004963 [Actinostola sp. cb2023]|nr:hypothetical protein QZH41_004963 [Actinostola sp. cb2023]
MCLRLRILLDIIKKVLGAAWVPMPCAYNYGSWYVKLDIIKKVLGAAWVPIPCVYNYGSCTYNMNFCELLRGVMFNTCDPEMENQGIPCDCPIPTGKFTIPTQAITVTKDQIAKFIPVGKWLLNGKYRLTAEFLDDRHLGCIQLQMEVDINSKKKKRSLIRIQI